MEVVTEIFSYLFECSRERNRMHAKMTRDRKKCFIKTIEKTIEELERGNQQLRDILSKVSVDKYSQMVTPITSPALKAASRSRIQTDEDTVSIYSQPAGDKDERPAKRRSYDLSLVG